MQATAEHLPEHLFRRGARGTIYLRRRIPAALRDAYPRSKKEIQRSLWTSDLRVAKTRMHAEEARLNAEFAQKRAQLAKQRPPLQRTKQLTDEAIRDLGKTWINRVLDTDDWRRSQGLDDEDFDELGEQIDQQRKELGRLLAQGRIEPIIPAFKQFLFLCGIDAKLEPENERQAAYVFLQSAVKALNFQAQRHAGDVVETAIVAPAVEADASWDEIFEVWDSYVVNRPKPTTTAAKTHWNSLERYAKSRGVMAPRYVTATLMTDWVDHIKGDLDPGTTNDRLTTVRAIFTIAVGKNKLRINPAEKTLGVKVSSRQQRQANKRLPFSEADLQAFFGGGIFTKGERSRGQGGEACYWMPLIMGRSGARPEEVAGLLVKDVKPFGSRWYFHITDMWDPAEDGEEPSERRGLKNGVSRRRVPVAQDLIDRGLLRYVEHVKSTGAERLFPTLQHDCQGKLSGAIGKYFGRYIRKVGITSPAKVLYSLRHCFKDLMERARVEPKYLQRLMGHASGDGAVTDGYGSDVPLEEIFREFDRIEFPQLPTLPWSLPDAPAGRLTRRR